MKFDLQATFTFSGDLSSIANKIKTFLTNESKNILKKDKESKVEFTNISIKKNSLSLTISSHGAFRPHNALLQLKNSISKELGKKHHIGVREISIGKYEISFELEQKPLKAVTIPFADVITKEKKCLNFV